MTGEFKPVVHREPLCPIVLASDDAYGMPLATTLRSVVEANPQAWPIQCYVLSDGIRERTRRKVVASLPENSVAIRWMPVELSAFEQFSTISHISKMTYARFLITRMIPPSVSKVLYLDCDLLVLDDLWSLCKTDLGDAALGAVVDPFMDLATKQDRVGYEAVPRVNSYFNAGVLLIDLNRWRDHRIPEKAMEYLEQHPDSPFSDQDALNVACDGQWKPLESRWNFQKHYRTRLVGLASAGGPGIVHFTTERKPWLAEHMSADADFYDAFRNRTRFARTAWERLLDSCRSRWARTKMILRKSTVLRSSWRFVKRAAAR